MIKKNYVSRLFEVNKKTICDFEILPNHRKIRQPQVERIYSALKQGKHFESPIVVNQRGKKLRVIDGGHRVNAMMMWLDLFPDKEIEVNMACYHELDDEAEKEVFGIWNKGIKQSPDDYINLRKNEIPIYKLLQSYPCKVSVYSPNEEGMKFKTLIGAYMGALFMNTPNSYDSRIDTFIEKAKDLEHKDHKFLTRFMEGFINAFGIPSNKNPFSSYVVFNAIMRVYYDNFYTQGETYLWNKMKSSVFRNSQIMQFSLSAHSRLMIEPCINEMLRLLNKGKRSNLFLLRLKTDVKNTMTQFKNEKDIT